MLKAADAVARRTFVLIPFDFNPLHTYRISKKVDIPPSILFDVVSDVASYKTFIPFVTESFVSEVDFRTKLPQKAGFNIGWDQYNERMICDVSCLKDERVFSRAISTDIFEHLQNEWKFELVKNGCNQRVSTKVSLNLQYRFKNPLFNSISSVFQSQVSQVMIDSFLKRATERQKQSNTTT